MIFGLSFGKKKQSSTQDTNVSRNESMTGTQQQATSGLQQSQSSTTSTGTQNTNQASNTSSLTSQTQNDRGTQSTRGTTTTLDTRTSTALGDAVSKILAGGVNDANIASLSNLIAGVSGFSPEAMVANTVAAARNRGEQELQERNAVIQSNVGGTDTTNSMAALLAERGRNDLEANIAGITAQVTGQAEGIRNANLVTGVQAQSGLTDQAANLANVLKGATTTVDQATLTDQLSQLLGNQSQTGTTTGTTTTAQQQNTATTELIQQLMQALTTQNSAMTGTENVKGTGKQSGGGFSLSL